MSESPKFVPGQQVRRVDTDRFTVVAVAEDGTVTIKNHETRVLDQVDPTEIVGSSISPPPEAGDLVRAFDGDLLLVEDDGLRLLHLVGPSAGHKVGSLVQWRHVRLPVEILAENATAGYGTW